MRPSRRITTMVQSYNSARRNMNRVPSSPQLHHGSRQSQGIPRSYEHPRQQRQDHTNFTTHSQLQETAPKAANKNLPPVIPIGETLPQPLVGSGSPCHWKLLPMHCAGSACDLMEKVLDVFLVLTNYTAILLR